MQLGKRRILATAVFVSTNAQVAEEKKNTATFDHQIRYATHCGTLDGISVLLFAGLLVRFLTIIKRAQARLTKIGIGRLFAVSCQWEYRGINHSMLGELAKGAIEWIKLKARI